MDGNITCLVCGSKDFYKESGYYFCSECQTQTQEIQELEFEEFDANQDKSRVASHKIDIKPSDADKQLNQVKLTTWECYNYALKGLTEELIILGADQLLRTVVKKLWMKYLMKLEVINEEKPKLQGVNIKTDAEIVYGKPKKKRRRRKTKNCSETDLSSLDTQSLRRERLKRRRILVKAEYDHSLSQKTDTSILNETLTTLMSSNSGVSSQSSVPLRFNKYAKEELSKRQSEEHLKLHSEDYGSEMSCHKNTYSALSRNYVLSAKLLSINKIYSLLYLGLLMTKSKIQLGDMLRFIREGHLSFNSFKHFFPEEMRDNFLTAVFPKKLSLSSTWMKMSTLRLAKFLDVVEYLEVQNLAALIERYCRELNIPRVIENSALSTLLITLPKMKIQRNQKFLPNYEARALSIILFQLKLYFALDGKTEKYLSDCADTFNKSSTSSTKVFNFMSWLQYLDYRNSTLRKLSFPCNFAVDKSISNPDLFVKFVLSKNPEYEYSDPYRKFNKLTDDCRQLLSKLKLKQEKHEEPFYFSPSLNPLIDYTTFLIKNQSVSTVEKEILLKDFLYDDIEFITNPEKYFKLYGENENVKVKSRGMNKNLTISKLVSLEGENKRRLQKWRQYSVVQVKKPKDMVCSETSSIASLNSSIKAEEINDYMKKYKEKLQKKGRNDGPCHEIPDSSDSEEDEQTQYVHYEHFKQYWINTDSNLGRLSKENFDVHFASYPSHFQFLVKEMAKMCEQEVQEFLREFRTTELYLIYVEKFQEEKNVNFENICDDFLLKYLIRKAKNNW